MLGYERKEIYAFVVWKMRWIWWCGCYGINIHLSVCLYYALHYLKKFQKFHVIAIPQAY